MFSQLAKRHFALHGGQQIIHYCIAVFYISQSCIFLQAKGEAREKINQ